MVNEALLLDQLFAAPNMDFEMGKFNWVGRINSATNIGIIWHTARAKTIPEAMTTELITGSTGIQSFSGALPRILNNVLGTKFKIVPGYGSARGLSIALERGEIEAYFSDSTELLQLHRDWLIDKNASVPVQFGNRRHPSLPDSPTVTELGRNPEEKQVLALPASISTVGKSFIAPPELPPERLAALRLAFDALMRDPVFITEAQQRGLELDPLTGDLLQTRVRETLAAPAAIVARAAQAWKP
jgi:tripartite-type tricarboxylate transporter receptor subunit TctC